MPDAALGIASAAATTGIAAPSAAAANGVGTLDKNAFLKLLVAQLRYQNPLSPTDPSSMMAQTAQFTMVESLQSISAAQAEAGAWQLVVAGQGLIGKQVTGLKDDQVVTGVVTSLTFPAEGPTLTLADGSTLAIGSVTKVEPAPAPA